MTIIVAKWTEINILSNKLEVIFLATNNNKLITEDTNQFLLKNFKVHFFYQKGQKPTVNFFASTKFHGRFHHFFFRINQISWTFSPF